MAYDLFGPPVINRGKPSIYNFRAMLVGDKLTAPFDDAKKLCYAAKHYKARYPGWNFSMRNSHVNNLSTLKRIS